jgi:hypothetical protein
MPAKVTRISGTPKVTSQYRTTYVTHEGANIMLKVYDMADNAGLTSMELTDILAEEVQRRISKMTWSKSIRRLHFGSRRTK